MGATQHNSTGGWSHCSLHALSKNGGNMAASNEPLSGEHAESLDRRQAASAASDAEAVGKTPTCGAQISRRKSPTRRPLREIVGGRAALEREWFWAVALGSDERRIEQLKRMLAPAANDSVSMTVAQPEASAGELAVPRCPSA